jgi:hypothetical protein
MALRWSLIRALWKAVPGRWMSFRSGTQFMSILASGSGGYDER